jgi:hypothetical protein
VATSIAGSATYLNDLLKAHRYWRALGLPIDLVLVG